MPLPCSRWRRTPFYIGLNALATALVTPVFPILAFIMYFSNNEENPAVMVTPEDDNKVKVEDLYPKMPDNSRRNRELYTKQRTPA